jgi:hypothetical protein
MSREWLDIIKFIIDKAESLDLKVWLYDEDPFPSGAVGGKVFFEHPEFAAREIKFFELRPDEAGLIEANLGRGIVLSAFALRFNSSGHIQEEIDISDRIGILRSDFFKSEWNNSYYAQLTGKKDFQHYRAETFYPHLQLSIELPGGNWTIYVTTAEVVTGGKYMALPDNLNEDCVKYFIEQTHEKYKKEVGDKFGTVIPGIFTDEPAVGAPMPWTGKLEYAFEQRHGYSIAKKYHHLFKNIDDSSRELRKHYWETVYGLFRKNYFEQIKNWCDANSLKLCGHCIGEEDPLGTTGGSNTYALQSTMDIPGFDHITNNIPNGKFSSLNLGGKLISSSALQQGNKQVLSECFGCNPFNFSHDGMRKVANWLYALGVNWLVPHGFFYSYDGYRKSDAGRSFFFQHEDFKNFNEFSQYAERIGKKLGEADSLNHVCVIFPVSVFRSLLPAERKLAEKIREKLFECVKSLLDRHIQFDLADEETLLEARLEGKSIKCGKQTYDCLVLPQLDNVDSPEIAAVIDRFKESIPVVEYPAGISDLPALAGSFDICSDNHNLMCTVKTNKAGTMIYIFNNNPSPQKVEVRAETSYAGCYSFAPESGNYSEVAEENGKYRVAIAGFEAVILEFRKQKLSCNPYIIPENIQVKEYAFEKNPAWNFLPPGNKWLAAIDLWNISIQTGATSLSRENKLFCLARDITGTESRHIQPFTARPIFDIVPEVPSQYPLKMEFVTTFDLSESAMDKELLLVFESDTFSGNYQLFINDQQFDKGSIRRQRIYDPWNYVAAIKKHCHSGSNTLKIVWAQASEFDGLRSSIYISAST